MRQAHGAEEGREHQGVRRVERMLQTAGAGQRLGPGVAGGALDPVHVRHRGPGREDHRPLQPGRARDKDASARRGLHDDPLGDVDDHGRVEPHRRRLAEHRARGTGEVRGPVAVPGQQQEQRGHADGGELEPVLEGLHEGGAAHPAARDVDGDDDRHDHGADPHRRAGRRAQREAGPLQLWHQVEPADGHDQHRGEAAHGGGAQSRLGEVGDGVGPRTAQRRGDEQQQDEVAGDEADRVPEHVGAVREDQAGDAQEGRGRQVLPADRAGVPQRGDPARGHHEVRGRAGQAQAVRPDAQGEQHDQGDRGQVRAHERSTRSTKSRSLRSARRT